MLDGLIDLAEKIKQLHEHWQPHGGQIPIGKAIIYDGAKKVFVCAGRSFGKSRLASYLAWRFSIEKPGSTNYIFCPFITQAREIYWASKLIQSVGPEDWIESINITEMRITFKNKSMIKICGSDSIDSYRGVKCNPGSLVVFEEFKDIKEDFVNAFMPNLSVNNPTLLIVGTPPSYQNIFNEYMGLAQKSPNWKFFHAPSSSNPYVSKDWLADEKQKLLSMGDEETYLREFEAVFVTGGRKSIFPAVHAMPRPQLKDILPVDLNKWVLICSFDPASTSIFAAAMAFFNPYTKKVIIFDEIYENDPAKMTARSIYAAVEEKIAPYRKLVKDIRFTYDSAAAWFVNEVYEIPDNDWWLEPTNKSEVGGIEGYIAIIRSVMQKELLTVTSNCQKWYWEFERYEKDDRGRIPDSNNHLCDLTGYKLQALGFNLDKVNEPAMDDPLLQPRFHRMDEEIFAENPYQEID